MIGAIGAGMMAGSSLLQGFMGSSQKKNEAAVAKYNAAVKREEAKAIKYRTEFMLKRHAEMGARVKGDLEAAIGGSGTVSTEGAPMLAMALQESELNLENFMIGWEGMADADRAESQAQGYDIQRDMAKLGARQSLIGGFLGAGASAFMMASQWPQKTDQTLGGTTWNRVKTAMDDPYYYDRIRT